MRNIDGLNNNNNNFYNNSILPPQIVRKTTRKRRAWKWIFLVLVLLAGAAFVFGGTILNKANKIFTNKTSIFARVGKLFVSDDKPLKGEEQGRVNILLLGMGGPGHEGPLLTDTMIVASFNVETNEVTLISIPRDFMVQYSGRGFNKVNAAYAFAEQNEEGTGGEGALEQAEKITGLDIPYYASIDFKGFVKAVDHVGGVDLVIDKTFTDSTYPDYNNGYLEPQTFNQGPAHLNGDKALVFARSRHGNNGEGSDFARSVRQKKVMLALKEKLKGLNLSNVSTLNNLLSTFTENFRTNMEPYELIRLANVFAPKVEEQSVYSLSVDPQANVICDGLFDLATGRPAPAPVITPDPVEGEEGETTEDTEAEAPATTPTEDTGPTIVRAYVVVPCSGKTIADVHAFVAASMKTASLQKEDVTIEIFNSTGKIAATTKLDDLTQTGINVKYTSYKGKTVFEKTIVYDNSSGNKPNSLNYILNTYGFSKADVNYPQSTADIVIILGNDALK